MHIQDESRLAWWLLGRQGSLVVPRLRISANSAWNGLSVIHPPSQPGFPAPDSGPKKFNSRLVTPTFPDSSIAERVTRTRRRSAVRSEMAIPGVVLPPCRRRLHP